MINKTDEIRVGGVETIICGRAFESNAVRAEIGIVLSIQKLFPSSESAQADIIFSPTIRTSAIMARGESNASTEYSRLFVLRIVAKLAMISGLIIA